MSICSANNIPNTYSAGLSIQALGRPLAKVPRFFWTFLCFVIYTVAGVVGREHFATILSNFLSILSYWTAFFVVIVAEEHFIFRRRGGKLGGYNLEDWDDASKLPLGLAGIFAGCCGVAGAVVGMAEVWYIGPIGALAGTGFGADLGFEVRFCKSLHLCTTLIRERLRIVGCCFCSCVVSPCPVVGDSSHWPMSDWRVGFVCLWVGL